MYSSDLVVNDWQGDIGMSIVLHESFGDKLYDNCLWDITCNDNRREQEIKDYKRQQEKKNT